MNVPTSFARVRYAASVPSASLVPTRSEMTISQAPVFVIDNRGDACLECAVRDSGYSVNRFTSVDGLFDALEIDRPGCLIVGGEFARQFADSTGLGGELLRRNIDVFSIVVDPESLVSPDHVSTAHKNLWVFDYLAEASMNGRLLDSVAQAIAAEDRREEERDARRRYESLSQRQRETFWGVVFGMTNEQIAAAIDRKKSTVDHPRKKMFEKMGAANPVQIAVLGKFCRDFREKDAPFTSGLTPLIPLD